MLASARQLGAAGLERGAIARVALLLVAGATQPPLGVRVGEVRHTVGPHALRELTHLVHIGRVSELLVLAAWGQSAARLLRGTELRVVLLFVAQATELPAGIRIGEVRHAVGPDALPVLDGLLL